MEGDAAVNSSTIVASGAEDFLSDCAVPSFNSAFNVRSTLGDSGENDGKDVKDLSEGALEDVLEA
jgi:hypothetical protein